MFRACDPWIRERDPAAKPQVVRGRTRGIGGRGPTLEGLMTTIRPASPGAKSGTESVRRNNLGLVLRAVLEEGEATRARVAARVGLTRAAVS